MVAISLFLFLLSLTQSLAATNSAPASTTDTINAWSANASLSLKEIYDSNVHMQSVTPLANQDSLVTVLTPSVGAQWKPRAAFSVSASYSPEIAFYHSQSSEDYVAHRGAINFGGKIDDVT